MIWRVWSADPKDGHIKIYIDGNEEAVLDIPFKDFFENTKLLFNFPELVYKKAKGLNNYVPISFQKSKRRKPIIIKEDEETKEIEVEVGPGEIVDVCGIDISDIEACRAITSLQVKMDLPTDRAVECKLLGSFSKRMIRTKYKKHNTVIPRISENINISLCC